MFRLVLFWVGASYLCLRLYSGWVKLMLRLVLGLYLGLYYSGLGRVRLIFWVRVGFWVGGVTHVQLG